MTGDPCAPLQRMPHQGEICEVEGCNRPRRKVLWCGSHYNQVRASGEAVALLLKSDALVCVACGAETGLIPGFRKFCSDRCKRLWQSHKGTIPCAITCAQCGTAVSLVLGDGRRRKSNLTRCDPCRAQSRFCVTAQQLADRDGLDCRICKQPVDLSLRAPDGGTASVDHIVPRSRGGQDVPENCQLAHLVCNIRKGSRVLVAVGGER